MIASLQNSPPVYPHRRVFTARQEREHRERIAFCSDPRRRMPPGDRHFVREASRLRGNLDIATADQLAALVERLFWADRDGRPLC